MDKFQITTEIRRKKMEELSNEERKWMDLAILSAQKAYAPYSNFQVGSVVVLENESVISGNNQENAAYPSGLCAERVALFYANSQNPDKKVTAIILIALKNNQIQDQISLCGSCRQVLLETEKRQKTPIQIYLIGRNEVYMIDSAESLLPLSFSEDNL